MREPHERQQGQCATTNGQSPGRHGHSMKPVPQPRITDGHVLVRIALMIVEQYWAGIAQRLQIESGMLHSLIPHAVTKGTENELALARVIEKLVPPHIGVGSGIIFDHEGTASSQTDVVLYDKGVQPQLLAQTNQVMFPIETVKMAIEVKTSLRRTDILEDFPAKKTKLERLKVLDGFERPEFALFAYSFADSDLGRSEELTKRRADDRPALACVITPGFIVTDSQCGFVPLCDLTGQEPTFVRPPEDASGSFQWRGSHYPTYMLGKYSGEKFVGDPGRALLIFCMKLLQMLDQGGSYAWISNYTNPAVRVLQAIGE